MIDRLLKHTNISGTETISCRTENEKGMKHGIAHDLKAEHNLDNRGWLTHGWQKEKRGLSMKPYHKGERNLLLACSLFPRSEWKQFFQVKRGRQQYGNKKHNRTYCNYIALKPATLRKEKASIHEPGDKTPALWINPRFSSINTLDHNGVPLDQVTLIFTL